MALTRQHPLVRELGQFIFEQTGIRARSLKLTAAVDEVVAIEVEGFPEESLVRGVVTKLKKYRLTVDEGEDVVETTYLGQEGAAATFAKKADG